MIKNKKYNLAMLQELKELRENKWENDKLTWGKVADLLNNKFETNYSSNAWRCTYKDYVKDKNLNHLSDVKKHTEKDATSNFSSNAKILIFDIETAPMLAYVWGLWDQNVGLNQIESDWYVLSFAAKWLGSKESDVIYYDQRNAKNIEDDSVLLKQIWDLLNEADIVITQNGKKFDVKKLNARFILNGFQRPSNFRHIDMYDISRRQFGFTSNKLEYLTNSLCVKYKKLKHAKFSGFELWKQCLNGNMEAWKEMEEYNKYDVLSLEELYTIVIGWDNSINFNLYKDNILDFTCNCSSKNIIENGFDYTNTAKYRRYRCTDCGANFRDSKNLIAKESKNLIRLIK